MAAVLMRAGSAALLMMASMVSASADVTKGEQLARRWCASCHIVTPDQRQASADVPSFMVIARHPDFNAGQVALFLLDPHPKMPNMTLSRSEANDLADYIRSLR